MLPYLKIIMILNLVDARQCRDSRINGRVIPNFEPALADCAFFS